MAHSPVRRSIGQDIGEHQGLALCALEPQVQQGEIGLAALEAIIQVDQQRLGPLAVGSKVVGLVGSVRDQVIFMEPELLTHGVMEHLRHLHRVDRQPAGG